MRSSTLFVVFLGVVLSDAASYYDSEAGARLKLATETFHENLSDLQARSVNQSQVDALPQCAEQCLQKVLPLYGCVIGDSCFCSNGNLTASLVACVDSNNCTLTEGLAAQRFQADTCDKPVRDRGRLSRRLCWAMFTVATLFVIGRFLSRMPRLGGSGYSWDDWTVLFCYALLVPTDLSCEFEVQNGLGMDMYMLSIGQIVTILKWFYIGELFYNIIVMLTKTSLVLTYLRIWKADSVSSAFRIACWTLVAMLNATWIAGAFAIIFQCAPVDYTWLAISGTVEGHCIALEPFTYAYAALNIAFDVIVFFLPIHSLLKLKVPWPRKFGLCAVFLVGFLVTICSIIRLQYLVRLSEASNISWNFQYIGMWSLVEANFSIVCCCMPVMAGLVQRIWARTSNLTSVKVTRTKHTQLSGEGRSRSLRSSPRSKIDPTYTETTLEKGDSNSGIHDEEGFNQQQHVRVEEAQTAIDLLHRDWIDDTPTSARFYRHCADGDEDSYFVEIAHETPREPTTTKLSYRDQNGMLHEVEIIDRPQARVPAPPSMRLQRLNQRQRLETFGFGERTSRISSTGSGRSGGAGYSINATPSIASPLDSPALSADLSPGSTPRQTSRVGYTLSGGA